VSGKNVFYLAWGGEATVEDWLLHIGQAQHVWESKACQTQTNWTSGSCENTQQKEPTVDVAEKI